MNQNELYDIYSLWHVPFWQTRLFFFLTLLFIGSVVVVGVWFFIARMRRNKNKKNIWDQALHDLNQLNGSGTQEHGKEFYVQLLVIIKKYLHARYGYDVASKTDQELLLYLASMRDFPNEVLEIVRSIIDGSVIIRFANEQAVYDQVQQDFASSILIIKKTIPQGDKR